MRRRGRKSCGRVGSLSAGKLKPKESAMKKIILLAGLFFALAMPVSHARAAVAPIVPVTADIGGAAALGWMFPTAVASGAALVYIIGTNSWDPWHQLFASVEYTYPR